MFNYPVVRNSFDLSNDFSTSFDSLFDVFMKYPLYNSYENEDGKIVYELDVPGFTKEDIKVKAVNSSLKIDGEIKRKSGKIVKIKERLSIAGLTCENASLENGVLTIIFNKTENNGQKIEIE
jgi:HSP20 family molecular chaperone IbpA